MHGVLAGLPLDGFAGCGAGDLLVAVTERRTADEIETYGNLVRDYLDWSAPYLLTLPGLGDDLRDRLEHAARARAMEVEALYRLYPRFLNTDLLKAIRVEARMRRTASA